MIKIPLRSRLFFLWNLILSILALWWARLLMDKTETLQEILHQSQDSTLWMIRAELATFLFFLWISALLFFWMDRKERLQTQGLVQFLAVLTHELKTPLTVLKLQIDSLLSEIENKRVHKINKELSRLEWILEKTLGLSRVFLNSKPTLSAFNTDYLFDFFKDQESFVINAKIEKSIIYVEKESFLTSLKNVFENYKKHSIPNSPLIIEGKSEKSFYCLKFCNQYDPQSVPKNLSDLFSRGPKSTGQGIGLFIVKRITESFGGRFEVKIKNQFEILLFFKKAPQC